MFTKIDKALTAAIGAGTSVFLALGSASPMIRVGAAIGAAIVVGVATWWIPNKPAA